MKTTPEGRKNTSLTEYVCVGVGMLKRFTSNCLLPLKETKQKTPQNTWCVKKVSADGKLLWTHTSFCRPQRAIWGRWEGKEHNNKIKCTIINLFHFSHNGSELQIIPKVGITDSCGLRFKSTFPSSLGPKSSPFLREIIDGSRWGLEELPGSGGKESYLQ